VAKAPEASRQALREEQSICVFVIVEVSVNR
jgi:hypothetical protein